MKRSNILRSFLKNKNFNNHEKKTMTIDEKMKSKFSVSLSLLKIYVDYLQMIKHKDEATIRSEILKISNEMIDKFSFGQTFIDEIESYIRSKFKFNIMTFKDKLVEFSNYDESVINEIMDDKFKSKIDKLFDARFSSFINMQ